MFSPDGVRPQHQRSHASALRGHAARTSALSRGSVRLVQRVRRVRRQRFALRRQEQRAPPQVRRRHALVLRAR